MKNIAMICFGNNATVDAQEEDRQERALPSVYTDLLTEAWEGWRTMFDLCWHPTALHCNDSYCTKHVLIFYLGNALTL